MGLLAGYTERCSTCNRSKPVGRPCADCQLRRPQPLAALTEADRMAPVIQAGAHRPQLLELVGPCANGCGTTIVRSLPCPICQDKRHTATLDALRKRNADSFERLNDRELALQSRIAELEHEHALARLAPDNDNSDLRSAIGELTAKVAALFATGQHPSQHLAKGIPPHTAWAGFQRTAVAAGAIFRINAPMNAYLRMDALELNSDRMPHSQPVLRDVRIGTISLNFGTSGAIPIDNRVLPLKAPVYATPGVPIVIEVENVGAASAVVWGTAYGEGSISAPRHNEEPDEWERLFGRKRF